jgi:hypothetical protein
VNPRHFFYFLSPSLTTSYTAVIEEKRGGGEMWLFYTTSQASDYQLLFVCLFVQLQKRLFS